MIRRRLLATLATLFLSTLALLVLFCLLGRLSPGLSGPALASPQQTPPTVLQVDPSSAPNDLDVLLTITGTDFISTPTVYLGDTSLDGVNWVTSSTLEATVPWGMDPGVYALTVENPGGDQGSLADAFTVTQGIDVWTAAELYGGAVDEVAVNPQTPETLYAVSHDVGMFRSQDGAGTWTFLVSGGESSVRNLAVDPVSPTVLYMYMPWDLHRSDDGGNTWTPLSTSGEIPFPHPTDSGTVFASNNTEEEGGLWKSTNYGQDWTPITSASGLTDTRVNNLVFDPTDPMTMYVGTELGHIFVSTDGGTAWSLVDRPVQYVQALAINPRGDRELWVSNCCFCNPQTTLKSTNLSHTTWTTVAGPVGSASLTSIRFAPDAWGTYSDTVFVTDCWEELQKSEDTGDSWTSLDPQAGGEWHREVALHPSDHNRLYATGSRQAIYRTTDGGTTWNLAHEGLTALVPEHLAAVDEQPDTVYAVTDIGLLKGTGGGSVWQALPVGGDVSFAVTDPFTPSRVYAAGGDVGKGQDLPVYVSEDGGQTWPITSYLSEPVEYDQSAHLDPIIQPDPSRPGVVLAGVRHAVIEVGGAEAGTLYSSTNGGVTWTEVDVGQVISPVRDVAFDVVSPTVIYLATSADWYAAGSGLFRSPDGGATWQRVGITVADLDLVEDVAVEPRPPYRVFALANARVYVSEDRGVHWNPTNIFHGDIQSLLSSADQPESILYLATGMGLYRSTTGGDSWGSAAGVLGQVPIYSLAEAAADGRTVLYAGTTGGSVGVTGPPGLGQVESPDSLVGAGVYRYTSRWWNTYLPLVLRVYGQ